MKTIAEMSTAEILAEYNKLTGKATKRFADRATGEKQLAKARAETPAKGSKPHAASPFAGLVKEDVKKPQKAPSKPEPKDATRSAAIKDSWGDSDIAWKRSQRNNVTVSAGEGKVQYKSVLAAFTTLGLPASKHIKFRMELKAKGTAIFMNEGKRYTFTVVKQQELA